MDPVVIRDWPKMGNVFCRISRCEHVRPILNVSFVLQVHWRSEQEKQESKSIYATEVDAVARSSTSKSQATEPCPVDTVAPA